MRPSVKKIDREKVRGMVKKIERKRRPFNKYKMTHVRNQRLCIIVRGHNTKLNKNMLKDRGEEWVI